MVGFLLSVVGLGWSLALWGTSGGISDGASEIPCTRWILNHGSTSLKVTADLGTYEKYLKLVEDGPLHREFDFLEITPADAKLVGVDFYDFQNARTIVRDYFHGVIYDLLLSRVAAAVGSSAGKRSASDLPYSHSAAVSYFLAWQKEPTHTLEGLKNDYTAEYATELEDEKMALELFFGFRSFADLAEEITEKEMTGMEAEAFLEAQVAYVVYRLESFLDETPDEMNVANYFAGLSSKHSLAVKATGDNPRESRYLWKQTFPFDGHLVTATQITLYRRHTRSAVKGPRLLLPTYHLNAKSKAKLDLLVVADVEQGRRVLGETLALDPEVGSQLQTFLKGLKTPFSAESEAVFSNWGSFTEYVQRLLHQSP